MKANNSSTIKKANRFLVLDTIMSHDSITTEGIVRQTHLSRPTVLKLLNELLDSELVNKSGLSKSFGGRQAALFSFNKNAHYAIGIDMEVPSINLIISNLVGETVVSHAWDVSSEWETDELLDSITNEINNSIITSKIPREKIIGIGLGVPGTINKSTQVIVSLSRLPKLNNLPISKILEERLKFPTYILKNVDLLALAEKKYLSDSIKSFLFVRMRTGIGMAPVINDNFYEGEHGNSGYIGFTMTNLTSTAPGKTNKTNLEDFCSRAAIIDEYYKQAGIKKQFLEILQLALDGDEVSVSILENAGRILGRCLANVIKLFDISYLIIEGISNCEESVLYKSITKSINQSIEDYIPLKPTIALAQQTEDERGLGGCLNIIDRFFREPQLKLRAHSSQNE